MPPDNLRHRCRRVHNCSWRSRCPNTGTIPGAIAGVTLGVIANNVGCRDDGGDPCPEAVPLLGLAGAAGGALVGALLGSLIPKWHRRIP